MITLSQQQYKAVKNLEKGLSLKDIALAMNVSYTRVIALLNEVLIKTGMKSRKELILNVKSLEFEIK